MPFSSRENKSVLLLTVAVDQSGDVAADDLGERALSVCTRRPVPGALAHHRLRDVRDVVDVEMLRQLAVPLCPLEQLRKDQRRPLQVVMAGQGMAVALEDSRDDEL